jgi:hypothetical protein
MEGRYPKTRRKKHPLSRRELIVEVWNRLGRPAIGEAELREIQQSIRKPLIRSNESPAAIARMLADEGADLRHPEVIEFDARWREAQIQAEVSKFNGLEDFLTGKPLRLNKAEALFERLERLRQTLERSGDQMALEQTRDMVINARQAAELLVKDRTLDPIERAEQVEIVEWLKVWIQTPNLFEDWLDLRRRSPDFRKKFPRLLAP